MVIEHAGSHPPAALPNLGTSYASLALPEPLVREAERPGTLVMIDLPRYTQFLRENGLTEGVLVVWVLTADGQGDYHAIRPLNDPRTFSEIILAVPTLLPGCPRRPGPYQATRLLAWPAERLRSRAAAEEAIGQGAAARGNHPTLLAQRL